MTKTVFITGASSGFGKATAFAFHQKGWQVIATMRSPEKEQELTTLKSVLIERLDVQDAASITAAVKAGIERFGKIDVLVNNAGYGAIGAFESASLGQIKNQFEVNVFGLMQVTQAALPSFRAAGGGMIINISSFGGVIGMPFGSLYNSTKFAVEGFSEALSFELSALNILVKIIEPGAKVTEALKKATPEDVAATIYQAATDDKNQLRYVVGEDAQFYIDLKSQNTEPDFIRSMHDYFVH